MLNEKEILKQYFEIVRFQGQARDPFMPLKELYFNLTGNSPKVFMYNIKEGEFKGIKYQLECVGKKLNTTGGKKNYTLNVEETYEKLSKTSIATIEMGPTTLAFVQEDGTIIYIHGKKDSLSVWAISKDIESVNNVEKLVWVRNNRDKETYYYLILENNEFIDIPLQFSKMEVDLVKNYNDDLPYKQMIEFLESNNPGLIIMNGEPGTGKSSLIKHMIGAVPEKRFVVIQPESLMRAESAAIVDYFTEGKGDTVFILEDCEKLLMKRERGTDLHTLLNLSDGILGNTFNVKFICTFNTNINNIDPAILRKGRLKVRYEFGKLSLEKTRLHIPEAEKEMTLGEIYNQEENEFGKKEKKRIGF